MTVARPDGDAAPAALTARTRNWCAAPASSPLIVASPKRVRRTSSHSPCNSERQRSSTYVVGEARR